MGDVGAPSATIAEALLHATGASSEPVAVLGSVDGEMRVVWANRAFADAVCAEAVDLADSAASTVIRSGTGDLPLNSARVSEFRATLIPRVGVASSWDAKAYPIPEPLGCYVVTLHTVTDGLKFDELLRASEERFRVLSERAPIGIFSSEVGLRFGYVNDWFAELVGLPAEHLLGTGWMRAIDPEDVDGVCNGLQETLSGTAFEGPARLMTAAGEQRWVTFRAVPVHAPDSPAAFLGTVEDVTDRRRFEELLSWQASHDPLTGLPNRSQLVDEISLALADGTNDVAVLFLDLDDFKMVNDSLGHAAGDELLVEVASRLRSAVRDGDRVYRFAGDEFVVLARGASSDKEALGIANRLRSIVAEPVTLANEELKVRCSAGVVRAGENASPDSLLRDADTAMYQAKRNTKGSAALFDPAVRGMLDEDLEFTARVRDAISSHATSVSYRPVVALGDGAPVPVALDAALSLADVDGAEIPASTIMEIARSAKLTRPVVLGAVDQICADLGAWRADGATSPQWVSLSLTPNELSVPGLVDHVARSLVRHRLGGSDLAITVTRGAGDPSVPQPVVDQLAELGVRIASDEAAVSLTSLLRLAEPGLAAMTIRIGTVADDRRSERVIGSIVELARDLGTDVVALGLDSAEDVERAVALGLRMATGAVFGPSVIAAAVPSLFVGDPV